MNLCGVDNLRPGVVCEVVWASSRNGPPEPCADLFSNIHNYKIRWCSFLNYESFKLLESKRQTIGLSTVYRLDIGDWHRATGTE